MHTVLYKSPRPVDVLEWFVPAISREGSFHPIPNLMNQKYFQIVVEGSQPPNIVIAQDNIAATTVFTAPAAGSSFIQPGLLNCEPPPGAVSGARYAIRFPDGSEDYLITPHLPRRATMATPQRFPPPPPPRAPRSRSNLGDLPPTYIASVPRTEFSYDFSAEQAFLQDTERKEEEERQRRILEEARQRVSRAGSSPPTTAAPAPHPPPPSGPSLPPGHPPVRRPVAPYGQPGYAPMSSSAVPTTAAPYMPPPQQPAAYTQPAPNDVIASMGFAPELANLARQIYPEQRRAVEFLLNYQKLTELGYDEVRSKAALFESDNDLPKALESLNNPR